MGHLVSITIGVTSPEHGPGHANKITMKKSKTTKSDHIVIESIEHAAFIQGSLSIHDLLDQNSSGIHSGPGFKLWWTGSS